MPKTATSTIISISIIAVLLAVIGFMGFHQATLPNTPSGVPQSTQSVSESDIAVSTYSDALELNTVYVTPTGEKFHRKDCRHIQGAEHIFEIPIDESVESGYEPCKDCIK